MAKEKAPEVYIESIPVNSYAQVDVLSKRVCWDVYKMIRTYGNDDLSVEDILDHLEKGEHSDANVFNAVRDLYNVGLTHNHRRKEENNRVKGFNCMIHSFTNDRLNPDFSEVCGEALDYAVKESSDELITLWAKAIDSAIDKIKESNPELYPIDKKCSYHGENHKGHEFLYAVNLALMRRLFSTDKIGNIYVKNKWGEHRFNIHKHKIRLRNK